MPRAISGESGGGGGSSGDGTTSTSTPTKLASSSSGGGSSSSKHHKHRHNHNHNDNLNLTSAKQEPLQHDECADEDNPKVYQDQDDDDDVHNVTADKIDLVNDVQVWNIFSIRFPVHFSNSLQFRA